MVATRTPLPLVPNLVRRVTDAKAKEDRRRLAVQRVLEGETHATVAASLKVTDRSVRAWMKWYRDQGEDGLKLRPHPGPESKLTPLQEDQVCLWLVDEGGGVQGVAGGFGRHARSREGPQLVVHEREEVGGGLPVTRLDGFEEAGHVGHGASVTEGRCPATRIRRRGHQQRRRTGTVKGSSNPTGSFETASVLRTEASRELWNSAFD
jgi:hypothetical protein